MSLKRRYLNVPQRRFFRKDMGNTPESRAAWFQHMQETEPVCFHPEYEMWEIFRYADVQHVLFDYAHFSTEYVRIKGLPDVDDLGNTDPPRHRELRTLISKAFTPRSIEQLAPRITTRVDALLDKALAEGRMDVAGQLAFPLPVMMIAELLGVPTEDQDRFRRWSYQLMGALPNPDDPNYHELIDYFKDMLDKRARDPRDDLMSALLAAESDGRHLTRDEVVSLSVTLLLAGHITTTMMINHAIYRFDKQPENFAMLRADPSLIPGAVEEVLRYEFSMSNLLRLVRHDTTLAGHQLKEGQIVLAWTAAANFDESVFPHAGQFDIRRSPNPHVTFGYGVHRCLGAPLARLEGKIALERILARLGDIHCDPEQPVRFMNQTDFIQSLPILFTPLEVRCA